MLLSIPLTLAVSIFVIIRSGVAHENEFRVISSCVCHGCELVVECTITGEGATVWQGTIFDGCQNEKITLRHSEFISGIAIHESCETRQPIVGRSFSVAGGSYISQLLVNISEDLTGKTIECASDSGQIVGSKQIDTPPDFLPPQNITLTEINVGQLTFTWDSIAMSLSGVQYFVGASNCVCPSTTNSNFVRCNFTSISNLHECSLTVQTVVCGRIGSASDPLIITVKVPDPPRVQIVQVTEAFALVKAAFNKTEFISLTDETTVLATSYTINYSDSSSGKTCGFSTIPASSCGERICSDVFEVSSTSCFNITNIAVSFYASSALGNGPPSGRTLIMLQQYNDSARRQDYPMCMDFGDIMHTFIAGGVVALSVLILITAVFVFVTVVLIRSKRLIQKELKNVKESQNNRMKGNTVYEEIKPLPASTVIETTENTAYTCISRVCANSSL